MNAAVVCLLGIAVFIAGYRIYARYLAQKVFDLREDEPVPSVTLEDGVDYVPTDKHVLLGHHYASIAGAAPIIGPAIAIIWGWLPAVCWVIFGTVLMGAVHDFSTLVLSVRHEGKSVGAISEKVLGPRVRSLFLLVIFCLVLLVIAVFADAIAGLFVKQPGTVIPINFEIIVAVIIGYVAYKKKASMLWPSIAALLALYGMVWVGIEYPVSLHGLVGDHAKDAWVIGLMIYGFVGSVLPVWVLLQPRDFINSHQLIVGLGALIIGVLVAHPQIQAPMVSSGPPGAPFWFPFLFVTIACGAISGFHGLVSSGTTSKQLAKATDARLVGYGATLGEGLLALLATLAVSAGVADFGAHYHAVPSTGAAVGAFVEGSANFIAALGIPTDAAQVLVAVMVVSFAATSLDTGIRIQRYILQELGGIYRIKALTNRYVAGLIAVGLPTILYFGGKHRLLWPLFGGSNQLLAGLSLIVVTLWLYRQRKPWLVTAIPMAVVLVVSLLALGSLVHSYAQQGNYLLAGVGSLMVALEGWIILEGVLAVRSTRRER